MHPVQHWSSPVIGTFHQFVNVKTKQKNAASLKWKKKKKISLTAMLPQCMCLVLQTVKFVGLAVLDKLIILLHNDNVEV